MIITKINMHSDWKHSSAARTGKRRFAVY